ncbi:MAG TPA: phosphate ABC transporter permease subunit PstC [Acidimicrobiales bacterium]|nr:phosphate ABC transporter permease subunit PstC [Acidimicrobiales bacterium]
MVATTRPPHSPADRPPIDLSGDTRRHRRERVVGAVFFLAAATSVVVSATIVVSLFGKGWEFISRADWGNVLTSDTWNPRQNTFGVRPLVMGSVIVTGIAMLVAVPLGLGAAVYLSEAAPPRVRAVLKPILEVLAGVPSVVLGYFALSWIAPNVVGRIFGEEHGRGGSMLAAGIGVGILTIPLVASVSEDAMRAVPNSLREASAGIGARRITTTVRVVIPAAVSGLVAAFILAASRAIGETMVVFIAAGAATVGQFTTNPVDSGLTMTAAMASLATGTDSVKGATLAYPSLYMVGIVLFFLTLLLNVVGNRFVRRVRQAY